MIKNSLLVLTSLFIEIYIVENFLHLVNYMKNKNIFEFPYLSWTCDSHYSHVGADFYSSLLAKKILN